jgi:hypothetical protein
MPPSQNVRILCLMLEKSKIKTHALSCIRHFYSLQSAVHDSTTITHHLNPLNLPKSKFIPKATTNEHATREPGTLLDSELWRRDHCNVLENHGYTLRPRYRPDWVPSWKKSGKEFYTVEDGQPTLVRIFFRLMPLHP